MPLQPRHGYAAGFHRGLPASDIDQPRSSPRQSADARCCPAQICQIRAGGLLLRSVRTLVSLVHLPVSLAGPRPSDSAGPSRRCRGCLPPIPARPDGVGCPQLAQACCDRLTAVSFHHRTVHSASWRSTSHDHSSFGRSASSSGFAYAGWVSWSRRSRTPPCFASSSRYIVRTDAR